MRASPSRRSSSRTTRPSRPPLRPCSRRREWHGFWPSLLPMSTPISTVVPAVTRRDTDEVQLNIILTLANTVRMFDAGRESGLQYYAIELSQGDASRTPFREQGVRLPVL